MSNAFEIFRTILTGTSNFMSAPIRVSVKSDRYANAHGFFPSEYFFPYSESMNRCRQLYFYHFLMIFFSPLLYMFVALSTCLSISICIVGLRFYSFVISLCIHIFLLTVSSTKIRFSLASVVGSIGSSSKDLLLRMKDVAQLNTTLSCS